MNTNRNASPSPRAIGHAFTPYDMDADARLLWTGADTPQAPRVNVRELARSVEVRHTGRSWVRPFQIIANALAALAAVSALALALVAWHGTRAPSDDWRELRTHWLTGELVQVR